MGISNNKCGDITSNAQLTLTDIRDLGTWALLSRNARIFSVQLVTTWGQSSDQAACEILPWGFSTFGWRGLS